MANNVLQFGAKVAEIYEFPFPVYFTSVVILNKLA